MLFYFLGSNESEFAESKPLSVRNAPPKQCDASINGYCEKYYIFKLYYLAHLIACNISVTFKNSIRYKIKIGEHICINNP